MAGEGEKRIRDFLRELAINPQQLIPLDGQDQEEATAATISDLALYLATGGGPDLSSYVKADGSVPFSGQITVPTATTSTKAVNKGQMDAAIAAVPGSDLTGYVKADGTIPFTGQISVPTATTGSKAVNKAQLDAAIAAIPPTDLAGYVKADGSIPFAGQITVPTATSSTKAVNKGQMDAAIAAIPGGGGTTQIENIGTGRQVYSGLSGTIAQLRSLLSTTPALAITQTATEIHFGIADVDVSVGSGLMTYDDKSKLDSYPETYLPPQMESIGTGSPIYAGLVLGKFQIKSLRSTTPAMVITDASGMLSLSLATATPTNTGLMSATDKTNLDNLVLNPPNGGGPETAPYTDINLVNDTASIIDVATGAPEGTWFVLADASNADISAFVVVDFINQKCSLYNGPGGGVDLVASYGTFRTYSGPLTGTTGADNSFNISCDVTYKIYLENRTGSTVVMRYFAPGSGTGGGATALAQLVDVDVSGLTNGYVLTYSQTIGKWVPAAPTGGGGGGETDPVFNSMVLSEGSEINRARFIYDENVGEYQITVTSGITSSNYRFTDQGDILINGQSLATGIELDNILTQCTALRDEARISADDAAASAVLAQRWAADPPGSPISGGQYSAFAYSVLAMQTADTSRIIPTKFIHDGDLVSGVYTLKSGDLFNLLAFRNTIAAQLRCPPNLWRNSFGEAWVMARREGIGTITAVGQTLAIASPLYVASRNIIKRFPVAISVSTQVTEVLYIPALTTGKILVSCHSVHDTTGSKTLTLDSPTVGIPVPTNVPPTDAYTGANEHMKRNVWQFDIASYAGGDVAFRLTLPAGCRAALATIFAVNNAGVMEDNLAVKSTGVSSSAILPSFSTIGTGRLVFADFSQRSHTAIPAIIGSGLFRVGMSSTLGTPTGDDGDRFSNIGNVYGYEVIPDSGVTRQYATQFNAADGPTGAFVVSWPAVGAASLTSVVRGAAGLTTINGADGVAVIHASPDGTTYWFNAG
jgi:Coiled stalk of trimeric autotransporter adhesin